MPWGGVSLGPSRPKGDPGSWATRPRRGWWWGGRRSARCCCSTRRRGRGCWRVCSSAAPGWCGSTRCARSCCCCRWWPWARRSVRAGRGRCCWGWGCRCWCRPSRPWGCRGSTSRRSPGAWCRCWRSGCSSVAARGSCSCCGDAAGGCRRSWVAGCRTWRRASWWSWGSTSPAGRCGRSCARTRTTPARGTSRGCRRARGCRSTVGAPTRSRPWRGCPGTSGRWRWSWPWSCWPCSCGGPCCRRGRAGSTPGCRRCSSRPGRRCSRWRDPASRRTTRGPTAGC